MIWSTSYHHVTLLVHRSWPHLLFTVAFVHRRKVLHKLHRHAVHRSKASNLPFMLATGPSSQVMSWSSPPWSHDLILCLMCNELRYYHMCELCNISEPSSPSWHMLLTRIYLWTNHLCILLKHILIHLRLSLNYQNLTKTFRGTSARSIPSVRWSPPPHLTPLESIILASLRLILWSTDFVLLLCSFRWGGICLPLNDCVRLGARIDRQQFYSGRWHLILLGQYLFHSVLIHYHNQRFARHTIQSHYLSD